MTETMVEKRKLSPESLQAVLFHNPIAKLEYRLLTGEKKRSKRYSYGFLGFLFLLPFIIQFIDMSDGYRNHSTVDYVGAGLVGVGILLAIMTILTLLRTLMTTSDSLNRERKQKTFEQLVLTGLSARHILLGKWVGNMRHLIDNYVYLFWVRLAVGFWALMLAHANNMGWEQRLVVTFGELFVQIDFMILFIGALFSALLLATELFFSSALGMLFVNVLHKRTRDTAVVATRVGIPIVMALVFGFFMLYLPRFSYPPLKTVESYTYNNKTYFYDSYDWSAYNTYLTTQNPTFWVGFFGTSFDIGSTSLPAIMASGTNSTFMPDTTNNDPLTFQYMTLALGVLTYCLVYVLMGIGALRLALRIVARGQYWDWKAIRQWFVLRDKNKAKPSVDIGVFA